MVRSQSEKAVPGQGDAELLARIQRGEREACAQLVREQHAAVYRFLLHLTRDGHAAEDLTQETFAAAWQHIGDFQERAALGTWLHRIAYNKFADRQRRAQRATTAQDRLQRQWSEPQLPGPMAAMLADEQSRRLYGAVASLEEADRTVVVLHYLQEMSYREMAEVLGEPPGTVKWRTSQALNKLRSLLSDEPIREEKRGADGRAGPHVVGGESAASA